MIKKNFLNLFMHREILQQFSSSSQVLSDQHALCIREILKTSMPLEQQTIDVLVSLASSSPSTNELSSLLFVLLTKCGANMVLFCLDISS